MNTTDPALITEDWLKESGFKWHQLERQPWKHWTLWLAGAFREFLVSDEDLGIELTPVWFVKADGALGGNVGEWFCWLRADTSHRYSRFIHVRYLKTCAEVIQLVEALTGIPWNPANHRYGVVRTGKQMEAVRRADQRLDRQMLEHDHKWHDTEMDESRGRALPEHMQAAIDGGKAK